MRTLMRADSTFEDTFYLAFRKQEQNRATKLLFDCVLEGVCRALNPGSRTSPAEPSAYGPDRRR